uniref:Prefoldin subunit 1 n=1 Tax=Cyprinus carpio TaxID=7962 RepID=A0A8C2JIH2_CYPCA
MKKHANLTHAEITSLPNSTRMYEGAGRMFILQSKDEIANQLLEKQKTADEKIKEYTDVYIWGPFFVRR